MAGTESHIQVITTSDGSPSLYLPGSDETYHSRHGALTESMHVFIHHGMNAVTPRPHPLKIFEVGLGTGLNASLACLFSKEHAIDVEYTSIEPLPLSPALAAEVISGWSFRPEIAQTMEQIHCESWGDTVQLEPTFRFTKTKDQLQELPDNFRGIDLIFFDAFAPRVQPELWTPAIFLDLFDRMNPGGVLVTYCAKGDVRRAMQSAGFRVEKLPGPPGKREMLRARKADHSHEQ